ncbi:MULTISPECIES: hypothetical protein [Enterococcus]|uniref:hypothetical protein n=1 Tax=Enterococcus TaxID=1350 RepID=UPI0010FA4739|nr:MULTISPECIES: hypothetical protein [Enterococcus]MDT2671750.1 hypothetical protein [Enterococcus dongliensis]
MIKVTETLLGKPEKVSYVSENEATQLRLKYQFKMLLEGIYMNDVDGRDRKFQLVKNGTLLGYFSMEKV